MPFHVPGIPQILYSWNAILSISSCISLVCCFYNSYMHLCPPSIKTRDVFTYFLFIHSNGGWYLCVRSRSYGQNDDQSQSCPIYKEIKVQWGKQIETRKHTNTNLSKCHEERKLKAVWRMDYRGKWLKIRNVLWVYMLPNPQGDSHRTFQGRVSKNVCWLANDGGTQ